MSKTAKFEGKVALVTGSARGLGAAIAEHFASHGARVVLCDLDAVRVAEAAEGLTARHGVEVAGMTCDVSDAGAVEAMMTRIEERFGGADILVNNAGITRDNLIHKMSEEDWDLVSLVHLKGAFLCARAAQRSMVKRSWGRIVNLSSTSALGTRGQANYSMAKAGLQGFTRTLALELGRWGITVNCVAPGFIDTEMTRLTAQRLGKDPETYKAERARGIAVGRVGRPEDVAAAVGYFAGEEASFVSGQVLYVSGGPETRRG
jgi:3-oxoacyl-[acyl-carrier protein] reductase